MEVIGVASFIPYVQGLDNTHLVYKPCHPNTIATFYTNLLGPTDSNGRTMKEFIEQTIENDGERLPDPKDTFTGYPIDQLHCRYDTPGASPNGAAYTQTEYDNLAFCHAAPEYFFRRGCSNTCAAGYTACKYSESYVGCVQGGGSTAGYDVNEQDGQRSAFGLPTQQDTHTMPQEETIPQEETPPEQEPREQGEQPQNPNLTTYWDKECVCTDGAEYKSLRDLPETNDEGRCNSNEFVALCTQTYPGVFIQEQLQTYWDVECVETDGITYTAVDATQCE